VDDVEIDIVDPADEDAQACLGAYFAELDQRFATGYDPTRSRPAPPEDMRPPAGLFLVARRHGEALGCGGLKFHGNGRSELKRMWVAPTARGLGVGRLLLEQLEWQAAERSSTLVQLDTNHVLVEAIGMYRACGYVQVPAYNDEPYADRWFEKRLTPSQDRS
jgi:GNAT superfamily N-acetyltransferase